MNLLSTFPPVWDSTRGVQRHPSATLNASQKSPGNKKVRGNLVDVYDV